MAAAAVATGLFVGWQAYELRRAFENPFDANLQARQIDVCAGAIRAFAELEAEAEKLINDLELAYALETLGVQNWLSETEYAALLEGVRIGVTDSEQGGQVTFENGGLASLLSWDRVLNAETELRGRLAEMSVYSSDDHEARLSVVASGLPLTQSAADRRWGDPGGNPDEISLRWNAGEVNEQLALVRAAFDPVEARCAQVMLGEHRGLM